MCMSLEQVFAFGYLTNSQSRRYYGCLCLGPHGVFQDINTGVLALAQCPASALCNTHTLFSNQTDLPECSASQLWDGLLPAAVPMLKQVSLLTAVAGR